MTTNIPKAEDLDWVKLRQDMDGVQLQETMKEKAFRKFKENPAIPLGCTLTVSALTYGVYNFWHGRTLMSQYMMRARVVGQAFTVIAVVTSLNISLKKNT